MIMNVLEGPEVALLHVSYESFTLLSVILAPRVAVGESQEKFKQRQESARKDVERAFGVLKARWHIVKNASRPYHLENLKSIIRSRHLSLFTNSPPPPHTHCMSRGSPPYLNRVLDIQDTNKHNLLQNDFRTHIFYTQINAVDDPGENVAGDDVPDEVFENEEVPDSVFENDDNYDDVAVNMPLKLQELDFGQEIKDNEYEPILAAIHITIYVQKKRLHARKLDANAPDYY
ncbi:hypothetical protein LXL04_024734 [Taraxacum kok-saghyz]